jgi:hypothetical protein
MTHFQMMVCLLVGDHDASARVASFPLRMHTGSSSFGLGSNDIGCLDHAHVTDKLIP